MAQTLQSKQLLDGYEIDKLIGKGGMGEVYRARQVNLNRLVALKVLPPKFAKRDPNFARQFVDEARAAGRLNHPNIIAVYDVGKATLPDDPTGETEVHYFSMEYVRGKSVKGVMERKGLLPISHIGNIMLGVGKALRYAESQGIVHRDIKPDNIMLTSEGAVKLADLGLALRLDREEQLDENGNPLAEKVMGTPLYMSPEQAQNLPVDSRSDQYSLGATLYHMLTGNPPYTGNSAKSILRAHVLDPIPDPKAINPSVPEAWRNLCMKLMSKKPEDRYPTCKDMRDAIIEAVDGINRQDKSVNNRTPRRYGKYVRPRWMSYLPYGIGATVVLIAIVVSMNWNDTTPPRENVPSAIGPTDQAIIEKISEQLSRLPSDHEVALDLLRKMVADTTVQNKEAQQLIDSEISSRERQLAAQQQHASNPQSPESPPATKNPGDNRPGPLDLVATVTRNGNQVEILYETKQGKWNREDFYGENISIDGSGLVWFTNVAKSSPPENGNTQLPVLAWKGWLLPPFIMTANFRVVADTSLFYVGVRTIATNRNIFVAIDNTQRKNACHFWPFLQNEKLEFFGMKEKTKTIPYKSDMTITIEIRVDEHYKAALFFNNKELTQNIQLPKGGGISPIFLAGRDRPGDTTVKVTRLSLTGIDPE